MGKARDDAWIGGKGKANSHAYRRITCYRIGMGQQHQIACGCWDWEQRESLHHIVSLLVVGSSGSHSALMGIVPYRIASIWVSVPATSCCLLFLCPFLHLDLDHFRTPPSIFSIARRFGNILCSFECQGTSNQLASVARIYS